MLIKLLRFNAMYILVKLRQNLLWDVKKAEKVTETIYKIVNGIVKCEQTIC